MTYSKHPMHLGTFCAETQQGTSQVYHCSKAARWYFSDLRAFLVPRSWLMLPAWTTSAPCNWQCCMWSQHCLGVPLPCCVHW